MAIFSTDIDADGVATIAWDLPGRSMNVLTEEGIAELEAAVDAGPRRPRCQGHRHHLGQAGLCRRHGPQRPRPDEGEGRRRPGARSVRGHYGAAPGSPEDPARRHGPEDTEGWQARSPGPLPAPSAGIGAEIGLACHRRFVADNPKARVGLPEILIGRFPGAGGTTRLLRILG